MRNCSLKEIILEVPDIQTVILPKDWFNYLRDEQSVFNSLYEWMIKNGRVSSENINSLPSRTYVGEKLFKKLRSTEKKRIGKKLKIKGDELERAVDFSDINSGPKTEIGGCGISGDVILVIPESSKQALGEFSFKIYKKVNEAAVNKSRANAAGATFYQWLLSQVDRPDRVGDVARDAAADEKFPQESNQYEEMKDHLFSIGACSAAIESFKEGWLEYIQQYPGRVHPYAWCSECGKRFDLEDASLAWDVESQEIFVLDADCLTRYMRLDKMASRPLSSISQIELEGLVEKKVIGKFTAEEICTKLKLWGVIPITTTGQIYFVKSEIIGAIKIGFTAGQVENRLNSLQTAHPYRLKLLATTPGTLEYEKSIHNRFASFRLQGEWFEPHPDLLAFIAIIKGN